jgi:YD repeat-containing protein
MGNAFGAGVVIWLCFATGASAQFPDIGGARAVPRPDLGHDYIQLLDETVSPANGSVNIKINIPVPPQRGITVPFSLSYNSGSVMDVQDFGIEYSYNDSQIAYVSSGGAEIDPTPEVVLHSKAGWEYSTPMLNYSSNHSIYDHNWYANNDFYNECYWATNFVFSDMNGARHPLNIAAATDLPERADVGGLCPNDQNFDPRFYPQYRTNGDFNSVAHLCWQFSDNCAPGVSIATADGTTYAFDTVDVTMAPGSQTELASSIEDRNHNKVYIGRLPGSNQPVMYSDELGTLLTATTNMGGIDTITSPALNGQYTIHWSAQQTSGTSGHAQILGPTECTGNLSVISSTLSGGWPATWVSAISQIDLPNGTSYYFTYDPTYGLLKRITYPNGAYAEYDWGMQPNFEIGQFTVILNPEAEGTQIIPDRDTPMLPYYMRCVEQYSWPAVIARRVSMDGTNVALSQSFQYTTPSLYPVAGQRVTKVTTNDAIQNQTYTTTYTYDMATTPSNDPLNFTPAYGLLVVRDPTYSPPGFIRLDSIPTIPVANDPQERSIVYKDANGKTLKTVNKTWLSPPNEIVASEQVILGDNGPSTTTIYGRSWPGRTPQTEKINYDGTFKYTDVSYYNFGQTPLNSANVAQWISSGYPIFDRPEDVKVSAGTAAGPTNVLAETVYSDYDANGFSGTNGNVGKITQKCWYNGSPCPGSPSPDRSTFFTYNNYGQVTLMQDDMGNQTYYDYSGNAVTNCGSLSPTSTSVFPTSIIYPTVNAMTQHETYCYDSARRLSRATDVNGQTTTYTYNDPFGRVREADYPDNGSTQVTYNDAGTSPSTTVTISGGTTTTTVMDGMRRPVRKEVINPVDSSQTIYADTQYDGSGRVYKVSNPYYVSDTSPLSYTTFYYDALSNKVGQRNQDGTYKYWCYNGITTPGVNQPNCHAPLSTKIGAWVDSQDENGNQWQHASDAFGQLIVAMEPNGTTQASTMETDYAYSLLGNLMQVDQWGGAYASAGERQRTFTYDSLSRLITAWNPEVGNLTYAYTRASQAFCAGSHSAICSKTDARGIITNYAYDNLNRLLSKTYTNAPSGTLSSCYAYDTATNGIGRLAAEWTTPSSCPSTSGYKTMHTFVAYDPLGRLWNEQQCVLGKCTTGTSTPPCQNGTVFSGISQCYNLAGAQTFLATGLNSPSYLGGSNAIAFTSAYDSANRLFSLSSNWSDSTHPSPLFTADPGSTLGYDAAGALRKATLGSHILLQRTYDNRLRVTSETDMPQ